MGLDMYAYIGYTGQHREFWSDYKMVEAVNGETVCVNTKGIIEPREIAYWRKHPNLHGWMERLAQEKGLTYDSFNGVELELTWSDIERLEQDIIGGLLPHTQGFFYGDPKDDYYREHDLEFCRNAKSELFLGLQVFYNSSW
jgi:hypothetical protein